MAVIVMMGAYQEECKEQEGHVEEGPSPWRPLFASRVILSYMLKLLNVCNNNIRSSNP